MEPLCVKLKYWAPIGLTMLYLTGDTHFNHANIISYAKRPFKSITHHDAELIRRWNNVVEPWDTVIHLGDFCFSRGEKNYEYYRSRLNGNMVLVKGNHDSSREAPIRGLTLHHGGVDWWCEHYPVRRYRHNLCAHVHNLWRIRKVGMDVVVNCATDVWDYTPVSMTRILAAVKDAPRGESL